MRMLHSRKEVDPTAAAVARHVRALRRQRGLCLHELAVQAGIADDTMRRLEQGRTNPQLCTVCRVAKALDVSVNRLLWEEVPDA